MHSTVTPLVLSNTRGHCHEFVESSWTGNELKPIELQFQTLTRLIASGFNTRLTGKTSGTAKIRGTVCKTKQASSPTSNSLFPREDMSSSGSKPKKIGGEYGEIRANIDVDKLNTYLARNVKVVKTPVAVKQFKVCEENWYEERHYWCIFVVWTGK